MKKGNSLVLLLVVALVVCVALAAQFWFKPAVEQEISGLIRDFYASQKAEIKGPISVEVSVLSRTVHIAPTSLSLNPLLGKNECKLGETRLTLTMDGLLAASPLHSLLSSSQGVVRLVDQAELESASVTTVQGEMNFKKITAENVGLEAETLRKLLSDQNARLNSRELYLDRLQLASTDLDLRTPSKVHFTMGPITVTQAEPTQIATAQIKDIRVAESGQDQLHIRSLSQKTIRLRSDEEYYAIAKDLQSPNQTLAVETLLNLLFGDKPLVESTLFEGTTVNVEGTPVTVGKIELIARPDSVEQSLEVSGVAVARSSIEEAASQKLPLPEVMHTGIKIGLAKAKDGLRTVSASLGVDELFALDLGCDLALDKLKGVLKQIISKPLTNVRIHFADKSLLARLSLIFAPDGSGKALILKELTPAPEDSEAEKELAKKLRAFVEHPGSLTIASRPGVTVLPAQLESMDPATILKLFELTVMEGPKDLNDQIQEIRR